MTDTKMDLPHILAEHRKWLANEGGSRANLSGAKDVIILGFPDGWPAFAHLHADGVMRVKVGCQYKTLADGRAYWADKDNRREVVAKLRGWKTEIA